MSEPDADGTPPDDDGADEPDGGPVEPDEVPDDWLDQKPFDPAGR